MRYENDSGEINFSNSKTDEELKMQKKKKFNNLFFLNF